jgi:hypothetical protein
VFVTLDPRLDKLDSDEQVRRAAQIEANTRRVNEAIEAGTEEDEFVFICECGRIDCGTTILLGREEYEAVRTTFDRFLVVPGHELPEIEEVVEHHDGYLVVRKQDPEARELVEAADPRSEA